MVDEVPARPPNRQIAPAIWGILTLDGVLLFGAVNGFELPSDIALQSVVSRLTLSFVAPALALLLGSVLPAGLKDVLVFWRLKHPLPGSRAFSHFANHDPRIDVAQLEQNVDAPFPTVPKDQNALWYRLFKRVEGDSAIDHCNRAFMLLRELAAISVIIAMAGCLWRLFGPPHHEKVAVMVLGLFALQYAISAIGAANWGRRLVTSVLAAHSVQKR